MLKWGAITQVRSLECILHGDPETFLAELTDLLGGIADEGLDVGLVDVVDDDGGDGNHLPAARGHDGQEDEGQHQVGS